MGREGRVDCAGQKLTRCVVRRRIVDEIQCAWEIRASSGHLDRRAFQRVRVAC
jgi:hypothetical protein